MTSWEGIKKQITKAGVNTFGRQVTFLPKSGDPYDAQGVFTRDWVEIRPSNGLPISGYQTVLDIDLADHTVIPSNGDRVRVDGVEYKIVDRQADGGGGARLVLNKV